MDGKYPEHSHTGYADIFSIYGDIIWIILGVFLLILFFVMMYRAKLQAQRIQAQLLAHAQVQAQAQRSMPSSFTIDRHACEQHRKPNEYDDLPPKYEDVMSTPVVINAARLPQNSSTQQVYLP